VGTRELEWVGGWVGRWVGMTSTVRVMGVVVSIHMSMVSCMKKSGLQLL